MTVEDFGFLKVIGKGSFGKVFIRLQNIILAYLSISRCKKVYYVNLWVKSGFHVLRSIFGYL